MIAYADGADIECRKKAHVLDWSPAKYPDFSWVDLDYRVKETKPSADWSQVSDEFNALATDHSGSSHFYDGAPAMCATMWGGGKSTKFALATAAASFQPGNCDWKDSLVLRPGYEGER